MKQSNVEKFAKIAGILIQTDFEDDEHFSNRNFLRFRIEIDVHEPIARRVKMPRKTLRQSSSENSNIWVEFKYDYQDSIQSAVDWIILLWDVIFKNISNLELLIIFSLLCMANG